MIAAASLAWRPIVLSLEALGYQVAVAWPRTPHGCPDAQCRAEYTREFAGVLSAGRGILRANRAASVVWMRILKAS